jgi:acetylornithine deacetylase/succinyl-diaminopimelate desuccinylase-like protein
VHGAKSDLHSGEYGGAVANPGNALAAIIASLHDEDGRIAIPGFYDDVVEWDAETRAQIAGLPHSDEDFARELDVQELVGEAGFGTLERLWIRPTCDVNGILCGYTGEGAKTVLPNHAMAKVSFRLVPDQDPARVKELFEAHLTGVAPDGVTVEVVELHGGRPWKASVSGPAFEAAADALEEAFGTRPVAMGGGGSIPIVVEFEESSTRRRCWSASRFPDATCTRPTNGCRSTTSRRESRRWRCCTVSWAEKSAHRARVSSPSPPSRIGLMRSPRRGLSHRSPSRRL